MVAEDTVFSVLTTNSLFGEFSLELSFAWMFYAMIRYRVSIIPDTTDVDHIVVGSSLLVDRHNTKVEVLFTYFQPSS